MRTKSAQWFETKVKYLKTQDDGTEKTVQELYVVDALSCTEAETAVTEELSASVSGEMNVDCIGKACYNEVFFSDDESDDKWYKAKLQFITIDEKTEKEKRSNVTYLVQAKSLARALRYVDEVMGGTMIDYDTVGINETKVMDVFEHSSSSSGEKKENNE